MKTGKLEDRFNPSEFENKIYENWEESGYFKPSDDKTKKPYTIVIPPPNITGKLHMGHALDETYQDILIRYKRMCGYNALWVPGTDHAAIATEVKIVAKMKEEGISKEDLGREGFLKRAWEWKKEYGGTISKQLRKLGCSCDWSRERFTMDEGLSNAVNIVFENLYNKGYIYRGKRMITWCPSCHTSLSDAEVEYEDEDTHLWHIRYSSPDGKYSVVVATTRPETMFGDTAVAVHPDDERYKDLVGKTVVLPIMNKEIPIIADEFVEKEFGTGVVKITPAHDPNDYEAGLRHNLPIVDVFDSEYNMNDLVPEYKGMDVISARKKVVEQLEKLGVLVKIEDYKHSVGTCYRCHSKVEPKISEQWFVKMDKLAEPAIKAVKDGEVKFTPERFDKVYYNWMENIKDWCISRQLWWGHRIPAYYCDDCKEITVSKNAPEKCSKCGSTHIHQDEDTLDTWFSSALWPFSTLGWPEQTEDFKYFYPTATLITGYDIIFFWVARMIFSAIEHTGKVPFENVLFHGIVRDAQGRKMSKSLGNGIDPLEVIEKYGTDALRFSLTLGISPGNDIRYSEEKLEAAGNFANKIWNASKFVMMNLEQIDEFDDNPEHFTYEDKWILSKLNNIVNEVRNNLDNFDFGVALQKIYDFTWDEFCDWYIEMVKPRLYNKDDKTRNAAGYVLNKVLTDCLKLLHPFMPFVTEEIYTKLPNSEETIMLSTYPEYVKDLKFDKEEEAAEQIKEMIVGIRNIRSNMNVHPSRKAKMIIITTALKDAICKSEGYIKKLGFGDEILIQTNKENIPQNAVSVVTSKLELYMPFEDLVDIEEERQRLEKEKEKILKDKSIFDGMLSNPGFIAKAPEAKIQEAREKQAKFDEMLKAIDERMIGLK
ncbi:MAG: valine--tRNA ligase [Clostridia bacterium]|nr:valine--tRNA ligase [Clostridia bacterium]